MVFSEVVNTLLTQLVSWLHVVEMTLKSSTIVVWSSLKRKWGSITYTMQLDMELISEDGVLKFRTRFVLNVSHSSISVITLIEVTAARIKTKPCFACCLHCRPYVDTMYITWILYSTGANVARRSLGEGARLEHASRECIGKHERVRVWENVLTS